MFRLSVLKVFVFGFVFVLFLKYISIRSNHTPMASDVAILNHFRLKEKTYITTVEYYGRLGNMLFRCASLYGIAKQLGRFPYISSLVVPQVTIYDIGKMFPLFPDYFEIKTIPPPLESTVKFGDNCCKYESPLSLEKYKNVKYLKVSGIYLHSYKYFFNYQQEIKDLMECSTDLKSLAQKEAERIWRNDFKSHKLCVHIRRTDFMNDLALKETTSDFLIPAISFIYDKILATNVSLFFIGDDEQFCKKITYDRQFTSINTLGKNISTPELDMCFSIQYCDTFLLSASSSSFGWWIGYLMKSQGNVYYNADITKIPQHDLTVYSKDIFPPHWKKLKLLNNSIFNEN